MHPIEKIVWVILITKVGFCTLQKTLKWGIYGVPSSQLLHLPAWVHASVQVLTQTWVGPKLYLSQSKSWLASLSKLANGIHRSWSHSLLYCEMNLHLSHWCIMHLGWISECSRKAQNKQLLMHTTNTHTHTTFLFSAWLRLFASCISMETCRRSDLLRKDASKVCRHTHYIKQAC